MELMKKYLDKSFVFALVWSIGGALDSFSMKRFDMAMSQDFNIDLPKGSLYDCFVDLGKPGGEYRSWSSILPEFSYSQEFAHIVVPTNETMAYGQLLRYDLSVGSHVFFTGKSGAGKSVISRQALLGIQKEDGIATINLTYSAQTTSSQT